nr:transposase [Micromonospora globispora]
MPRRRDPAALRVVHRTARVALRVTSGQRRRCFGLLRSAGNVWACVLEINAWRRRRRDAPLTGYQELCRELAASGPGTFAELDSVGARSVLRCFSDAWFAAAKRRKAGDLSARFPRRRRALMPLRWHHGTFTIDGRRVRIPTSRGTPPLWVRLARDLPYPLEQIRSITLLCEGSRLFLDVTAEVPVTVYAPGCEPDPQRVAGVDLGIIHPYAVAGPNGKGLLVSGRAIRAEHRMHLADTKARRRAVSRRAPRPGEKGSRRWRQYRRRARQAEGRHRRRIRQAQHEAARTVISWTVRQRIGVLHVGDPRGVLDLPAGRRHNLRLRQWQIARLIQVLTDKATLAGITVRLVNERGTSSTCPACQQRVPKPRGRTLSCPHCRFSGHRDLVAAASIATRTPGGGPTTPTAVVLPQVITHRRAGRHLPGAGQSRRDPRRPQQAARGSVGPRRPAPPPDGESLAHPARIHNNHRKPGERSWTPH